MKTNSIKSSMLAKFIQGLLLVVVAFSIQADDTEVFFTSSQVNSNVLFVMDNSGSMSTEVADSAEGEQIGILTSTISQPENDAIENKGGVAAYDHDNEVDNDWKNTYTWVNLTLGAAVTAPDDISRKRIGLRFTNIKIPNNTEIVSAYIQFTAESDNSSTSDLRIGVQMADNASQFQDVTFKNIASRTLSDTEVLWHPAAWTKDSRSSAQRTPDLKSLVQLVVNRPGWATDNSIVFVINTENVGTRVAYSYEMDNGQAPALFIKYKYTGKKTRMRVMQDALSTVLADSPTNLSVGIMNYGDTLGDRAGKPNGIKFAVSPVNSLARPIVEESLTVDGAVNWSLSSIPEPESSITVGNFLSVIADDWSPNGYTPIVDALYEAALYYKGEEIYFGNGRSTHKWAAHPTTYTHPDPNKVESITSIYNIDSCNAIPWEEEVWNEDIAEWDNGETWGLKCPADRLNPSGPGLASNCASTKHDCQTESYAECLEWNIPEVRECTGGNDEAGNCKEWTITTEGDCKTRGEAVTEESCKYSICNDSKKTAPRYKTPIVSECQSNNIILMSDGKPEYENVDDQPNAYDQIKTMISAKYTNCDESPRGFINGACGKELTHYLSDKDINTNGSHINTFVIGFSSGITAEAANYLRDLVTVEDDPATDNKEGYFSAQNEAELAAAFKDLLDEIAQEARSQASPGYSVNVKSGLEHEDDIYIPVFDKRNSSRWSGNLKKFKLVENTAKTQRIIRGRPAGKTQADGNANNDYIDAMNETGVFLDTAWDEWSNSTAPDGANVETGGTASLLNNPNDRNLYSNLTGDTNVHLAVGDNNKIESSSSITLSDLGFDSSALTSSYSLLELSAYKHKLISYIRGWVGGVDDPDFDPSGTSNTGSARLHMGDMLHSEPVVITYHVEDNDGNGKRQYIFAATNEGYLHAFDSNSGEEIFAFMPKELLKNVTSQFTGEGEHKYGIDGQISYWHNDENHNGNVDGSEHVWLYFGLRRGGHSYYALDVTNINSPILKWVINDSNTDFSDLGQTWSMPYIANVLVSGTKTPAVIFTGGNDIDQDYGKGDSYTESSVTSNVVADKGKNIYIVDADNGSLLWKMSNKVSNYSELTHAIPGGARILDVNRNGLLDRMYFADTGGDVWRLDLGEDLSTGTSILKKFASLGGSSASSRKFYNEPDVAMLRANGQLVYTVSVGSGLRPHPMNSVIDDYMFVLLDWSPLAVLSSSYQPIVITDLAKVEISKGENGSTTLIHDAGFGGGDGNKKITDIEDSDGNKKKGWYVEFGTSGEKVLATSMTFEGSLMFTTLVPEPIEDNGANNTCTVAATHGRIYIMDILTGEASSNLDTTDNNINDNDVSLVISESEIPGTPQTVANQLECTGEHCTHLFDIRIGKKSSQATTSNVADVESIYWTDPVAE